MRADFANGIGLDKLNEMRSGCNAQHSKTESFTRQFYLIFYFVS